MPYLARLLYVFAVQGLLTVALVQSIAWAQVPGIDSEEQALLTLINNYRASQGMPPLALSPTLSQAADFHSNWMADNNCYSHQCPGEPDPVQRTWDAGYPNVATGFGENIAAGVATAVEVFEQWGNSSVSNRTMISSRGTGQLAISSTGNSIFRAVGIARVYKPASNYSYWWTAVFGTIDDTGTPSIINQLTILDNPNLTIPFKKNYLYTFQAMGGVAPYAWSVKGKLPPGLRLQKCGNLQGWPRKAGTYTVNITVRDKKGNQLSRVFTLNVLPPINGSFRLDRKPATRYWPENQVMIFNLAGQQLLQQHTSKVTVPQQWTQHLSSGIYLAIVEDRDSTGQVVRRELKKIAIKN
ncbi:hypothetical protein HYR54_08120 [Candidatus Acetothermia bacterium]|nr:hypothetical protein [Candidatus Acetothermia bacterium]